MPRKTAKTILSFSGRLPNGCLLSISEGSKRMRKPYTGLPVGKPYAALGSSAIDWTPLLRIRVSANHQSTPSLPAVVDSGAPFCLFRADVADFLHLDLKKCPSGELGGIIGGPKDAVYFHKVNITIENNW